jgi:hypothetical protein
MPWTLDDHMPGGPEYVPCALPQSSQYPRQKTPLSHAGPREVSHPCPGSQEQKPGPSCQCPPCVTHWADPREELHPAQLVFELKYKFKLWQLSPGREKEVSQCLWWLGAAGTRVSWRWWGQPGSFPISCGPGGSSTSVMHSHHGGRGWGERYLDLES